MEVSGEQATVVRGSTRNMSQNHTDFEGTLAEQLALAGADKSAVSSFRLCYFEEAVEVAALATATTTRVSEQVLPSGSHAWDVVGYVGGGAGAVLVMALCVCRCCHVGRIAAKALKANTEKNEAKADILEVSWVLEAALSDHSPAMSPASSLQTVFTV